jgi:hypothetical protein
MSTRAQREADETRRKVEARHRKRIYGLDDEPPQKPCGQCRRPARGRFCYWCGKRRGLW